MQSKPLFEQALDSLYKSRGYGDNINEPLLRLIFTSNNPEELWILLDTSAHRMEIHQIQMIKKTIKLLDPSFNLQRFTRQDSPGFLTRSWNSKTIDSLCEMYYKDLEELNLHFFKLYKKKKGLQEDLIMAIRALFADPNQE